MEGNKGDEALEITQVWGRDNLERVRLDVQFNRAMWV